MPPKINKIEAEIKRLSKLDGNKICADCPEKMPTYVDLTHNVFVCTRCAGMHRDSQFKVKGISMSVFTDEDVQALAAGGNDNSNAVLLARVGDYILPNGNDANKMKDFIKLKYVDKKWSPGGGHSAHNSSASRDYNSSNNDRRHSGTFATPNNTAGFDNNDAWGDNSSNTDSWGDSSNGRRASAGGSSNAPIVIKSLGNTGKQSSFSSNNNRRASTGTSSFNIKPAAAAPEPSLDLLSLSDEPVTNDPWGSKPTSAPVPATQSNSGGFDPFGGPATAPANNNSFDPFGGTPSKSAAPAAGNAGFDPFASHGTPQQQQQQFGGPGGQQQRTPPQGGFDAFGPQSTPQQQQGGFSSFGSPAPQQQFGGFNAGPAMPMPFIKISQPVAPVAPVAPAAAPTTTGGAPAGPKNFSVFDDLVPAMAPPGPPTANPFDAAPGHNNPFGGPHPGQQAPAGQPNPFGPPAGAPRGPPGQQPFPGQYPSQGPGYGAPNPYGPPPGPYGAYPPQPGYPGGPQPQGFPGGPPPQGYPGGPAPHGYPPQGYPPQGGHPGAYPGYPPQQPGYPPQQPGYPPQQPHPQYGAPAGPPQAGYPAPGQQPPAQQHPPAAAAPDPFASMTGLAWNNAGGTAPSSQPRPAAAPGAGTQYSPSPTQTYTAPPAPAAAPSVNPFDMF